MKKIRQYAMVRLEEKYLEFLQKEQPHHPFLKKEQAFLYLGEIPNMLGHCAVVGHNTGRVYSGFHIDDFREFTEEEW